LSIFLLSQPARPEWVAAAYLGGARTAQTYLNIQSLEAATSLQIRPVSYSDKPFQPAIYYGYRAGYFFTRHFGLEGEFNHLKVYAQTERNAQISGTLHGVAVNETAPIDSVVQLFNITHGVNLLLGNFVARKAFRWSGELARFILSGKVGAGITIPHPINEVLGVSNVGHYQVGSPALQIAAGFEMRLWRRLYADTEVKYTRTRESVDIVQGTAESLLRNTHFVGGFAWHF
jgi:hypothetical protein